MHGFKEISSIDWSGSEKALQNEDSINAVGSVDCDLNDRRKL